MDLTQVEDRWVVSQEEAMTWHRAKDGFGPTFTGTPGWHLFMAFLEARLREYGAIDFVRNEWSFDRWQTSEWPDRSGWSLEAGGEAIEVASYGANSGHTGPAGITAPLVYFDPHDPPDDIAGKIVLFRMPLDRALAARLAGFDYEYRTDYESYPQAGGATRADPMSQSFEIFAQLPRTREFTERALAGGAAGAIVAFDAGSEQMAGMYSFPVPPIHDLPTLFVDRRAGDRLAPLARSGARATLRLEAAVTEATAYQLIAYLPGRAYGTPEDEVIQLTTHTDGPSISQDNGALGLLALVRYLSQVPRAERPRTLMVFLDCRHFMPGQEAAFAAEDWFARNPGERSRIVAMIGMEHLGQIEYEEQGDRLVESGRVGPSSLWTTDNGRLVELAIKAVQDNRLPSVSVRNVDRPGIHGREQGPWYGMAKVARELRIPAFATMGYMGAYWATSSRIERFDPALFRRQVATFVQLTGELMVADLATIAPR